VTATTRGTRTRDRIIEAAERLFAARGIHGVSLREITHAAGQRNNTALQYHFGDRTGVLRAIAERHLANLNARQDELYEQMRGRRPRWSVRDQVDLLVRPTAEYIAAGPSARAWLRLAAQLAGAPGQRAEDTAAVVSRSAIEVGTALVERVAADLGEALAVERVRIASEAVLHVIADRARLEDAAEPLRPVMPLAVFVELVIDMTTAAMTAPPSDALLAASAEP
jgi:AcrR family transcriptional regulator